MSRNRIKNSQSLHWMGVAKWVLIMGFVCLIGLSYMLCQNQNFHLASETSKLEKDLQQIQARNRDLELDLQRMKTVPELRRRLAAIHSDLVDVNRLVCVRLDQPNRANLVRTGLIDAVVEDQRP